MSANKKTVGVVAISLVLVGVLGFAIGSSLNRKGGPPIDIENENHDGGVALEQKPAQQQQQQQAASAFENKSIDELTNNLSEIMLPEEEFSKLSDAIYQTAMGLLMAQAQGSGLEVTQATEQELKSSIDKKYSRQFFASQNAGAMKDLTKEELVAILSFYNTPAGSKFLKLSPKIIEGTMTSTQTDLQQWLPTTVEALVSKLKGSKGGGAGSPNQPNNRQLPPGGQPNAQDDLNS